MSITGLLPSSPLHNTPFLNSIPCKLTSVPSTFKLEATRTAQILGVKDFPSSNYSYPDNHFSSIPQFTNGSANSYLQVAEIEIGECLALLDKTDINDKTYSSLVCKQVHGRFIKVGALKTDPFIANKLLVAYVRNTELLNDARKLFDEITQRTIASYAAFIGLLCRLEEWVELLSVFQVMLNDGMLPDKYLIPTILKACSVMELMKFGKMVHGYVIKRGIDEDVFVGNALIDMYASCGDLRWSKSVFDTMNERDVVSWTALIVAYMAHGLVDEAIDAFHRMELDGVEADLISWNALVFGLAQNGEIEMALRYLEEMRGKGMRPKINTWNGIISGCIQNEDYQEALDAFFEMLWTCLVPNVVTFVSILPACAGLKDLNLGKVIHGHSIKLGLSGNTHMEGSLIDMYWKCGRIDYAESVFFRMSHKITAVWNEMIAAYMNKGDIRSALKLYNSMKDNGPKPDEITYNTMLAAYARDGKTNEVYELLCQMSQMKLQPNLVTFNILISGYQQAGLSHEALRLFQAMQSPYSDTFLSQFLTKPIRANPVTVTCALAACADLSLQHHGKELHGYVVRNSLESNIFVSSALVDVYAKCCDMDSAAEVFWRVKNRNTVMWNTLLAGYIKERQVLEAFGIFNRMLKEGLQPSSVTFLILLPACGEIGALGLGREVHGCLLKSQFDEPKQYIASALIDMYAKCGSIWEAKQVFDSVTLKDVAIWNSMISSFSAHGMTKSAISLFEQMETSGGTPDGRTFVAVLSACARDGLVQEGWKYFNSMEHIYRVNHSLEHYTCMVGIMGTAGLLDEALDLIKKMPFTPDACMWSTLLRSCRTHSNPEIGERAARALFELEPDNASNYILLYNIYTSAGLWDSSNSLSSFLKGFQSVSVKECSHTIINSRVHSFKGGRDSCTVLGGIVDKWHGLADEMRLAGHFPQDPVFGDEKELDPLSCLHTEKLALCLGIISSSACLPIRVSKNLRMCVDCHSSAKIISMIAGREIFVKDASFYHHMKDGICSCQDRW